jgi:hypothetical protein
MDLIIRDINRMDNYPDSDEKRNKIPSWFKGGLMGTYHKGILAGLRKFTSEGTMESQC